MTKGKKWTLRLLGVAALALLVSLCLLGSTMARYTSKGDGSGSLTVALWDLRAEPVEVKAESVSPSDLPYYSDPTNTSTAQERKNQSAYIDSFTLYNNSDVSAEVSVALDAEKGITIKYKDEFSWDGGLDSNQANDYGKALLTNMGSESAFEKIINSFGIFDIALAYEISEDDITKDEYIEKYIAQTDTTTSNTVYLVPLEEGDTFTIDAGGTEDFYAEVIWTSIIETEETTLVDLVPNAYFSDGDTRSEDIYWESFSDDVDTILGMYAETITFNVTWTAVQASTLP